jgi:Transglycosylase SLT domain
VLTAQAALAIALKCLPPAVAPVMVGIAQHESGLDPSAVHHNANGTTDWGLAQVNSSNFSWTGLTPNTALDPCANLRAGAMVLFAKYNGNPPAAVKIAYANDVMRRLQPAPGAPPIQAILSTPDPPPEPDDGFVVAKPVSQQTLILP